MEWPNFINLRFVMLQTNFGNYLYREARTFKLSRLSLLLILTFYLPTYFKKFIWLFSLTRIR